MEQNSKLGPRDDETMVDRESYQRFVGKLIYLSYSRPDIAFAVSVVSQFMHSSCNQHLEVVPRILGISKETLGKVFSLGKMNPK